MPRAARRERRKRRDLAGIAATLLCVVFAIVGLVPLAVGFVVRTPSVEAWAAAETSKILREKLQVEARYAVDVQPWPLAVSLEANEIRFLERDIVDPSRWRATGIEQLSARTLPETFRAQIRMGAMSANDEAKDARVVFLPVGVAAPFELALHSPAGRRRIAADAIGNLRLFKDPA